MGNPSKRLKQARKAAAASAAICRRPKAAPLSITTQLGGVQNSNIHVHPSLPASTAALSMGDRRSGALCRLLREAQGMVVKPLMRALWDEIALFQKLGGNAFTVAFRQEHKAAVGAKKGGDVVPCTEEGNDNVCPEGQAVGLTEEGSRAIQAQSSNGGVAVNDGHVHGQGAAPQQVLGDITNIVPATARGGRGGGVNAQGKSTKALQLERPVGHGLHICVNGLSGILYVDLYYRGSDGLRQDKPNGNQKSVWLEDVNKSPVTLSGFEAASGSKNKKWRTSVEIERRVCAKGPDGGRRFLLEQILTDDKTARGVEEAIKKVEGLIMPQQQTQVHPAILGA